MMRKLLLLKLFCRSWHPITKSHSAEFREKRNNFWFQISFSFLTWSCKKYVVKYFTPSYIYLPKVSRISSLVSRPAICRFSSRLRSVFLFTMSLCNYEILFKSNQNTTSKIWIHYLAYAEAYLYLCLKQCFSDYIIISV